MSVPAACVVLTGDSWSAGFEALRSVGQAGIPVYAVSSHPWVHRSSRWCAGARTIRGNAADLRRGLVDWSRDIGADRLVVVPLSDRMVAELHEERHLFPPTFRLAIPRAETTAALLDKTAASALASAAGIDVLTTVRYEGPDDVVALQSLGLPVILRPAFSAHNAGDFKFAVCRTERDLELALRSVAKSALPLIAQPFLDVPDDAVEFALVWRSHDRSQTAIVTGRKLRQATPEGGVMVWGETDEIVDVVEAASRFLDTSDFVGAGGIEFIRDQNRIWFVEFNPRPEAIQFIGSAAGVDAIRLTVEDLLGWPIVVPVDCWHVAGWVGFAAVARARRSTNDARLVFRDRLRFAARSPAVRSVCRRGDPLPSLAVALWLAARAVRRLSPRG